MNNKFSPISLVLILFWTTGAFGQSESPSGQARALRGLRTVTLTVNVGWINAKPEDTNQDQLWALIAKRLREAGIEVRRANGQGKAKTSFHVYYSFARLENGLYSSFYLRLIEKVMPVRRPAAKVFASTWDWYGTSFSSSHSAIDDAMDRFLYDYKQANKAHSSPW